MHGIAFAAVGYLVGVFTPAVARKIKSWFSKETTAGDKKPDALPDVEACHAALMAVTAVTSAVAKKI